MRRAGDLRQFLWLLTRYLAPYWRMVTLLLLVTYLAAALTAALPLVMAPILDLALGVPLVAPGEAGTITWGSLSLKNLGGAFFQWIGLTSVGDRFRTIVVLCLVYAGIGMLKAGADFANYRGSDYGRPGQVPRFRRRG